jgi:hypothetical protein
MESDVTEGGSTQRPLGCKTARPCRHGASPGNPSSWLNLIEPHQALYVTHTRITFDSISDLGRCCCRTVSRLRRCPGRTPGAIEDGERGQAGRRRHSEQPRVGGPGRDDLDAPRTPSRDSVEERGRRRRHSSAARCRQRGHALAVQVREAGRVVNVHALIAHGGCDFGRLMTMALVGGRLRVLGTHTPQATREAHICPWRPGDRRRTMTALVAGRRGDSDAVRAMRDLQLPRR